MLNGHLFRGVLALSFGALVSACGGANFGGGSSRTAQSGGSGGSTSADATPDEVAVGVDYQDEVDGGFNLVSNALSGYKAALVGGDACWGAQTTPFSGDPTTVVKVRKNATGCSILFTELTFKDPNAFTLTNATGLSSEDTASKLFVTAASNATASSLSVKVAQKFNTAADSKVILSGLLTKVVADTTNSANNEIAVSAQGDVVAYPNVKFSGTPLTFVGTLDATMTCNTKDTSTASACVPAVLPQGTAAAGAQKFSDMEAAVVVLKGDAATGFPGSVTATALDSVFAAGAKINNVPQGISNIAAPIVNGDNVQFHSMTLPAAGANDISILVIRYHETVAGAVNYAYKAFRLGIK